MTLAALGLHDSPVSAAPKPTLAVALSPSSAIAGSAGNTLTFTFVATGQSTSRATVTIPTSTSGAPWSPPQTVNPSGAGYVTVQSFGCNSAVLAEIAGAGPWTVAVDHKCANNKSFTLTYRATAATRGDAYVFSTQVKVGQVFLPTTEQPVVMVTSAAASAMQLTGLANTTAAGASQSGFVTLFDAYSNVANGYLGTVHFTSNDTAATLPADHTFIASDNGSYEFTGLVLTKAGSTSITVADTLATSLQDVKMQTVSPGAVASLTLQWAATYLPFSSFVLPGVGNCGVIPYDAYGNAAVLTYTGEIVWTTTAPAPLYSLPPTGQYQPPPSALEGLRYQCDFYSPGTHTLTVTDKIDSSLTVSKTFEVLSPSPEADEITVLDPTHRAGVTLQMLEPLYNDWEYVPRIAVLRLASVGQATYTENGNTYQLGVARLDEAKRTVLWELNPPSDATASDPEATLRRCHPDGVGCTVTQPITMPYTVTDSVSTGDSTMALHISTPTVQFPTPTITFAAWPGGAVPSDAPGFLIPSTTDLSPGALSPPDPITGLRSLSITGPIPAGVCGTSATKGCTFQTTASVGLPIADTFSGTPIDVSLSQSLDVIGKSNSFRSVTITTAPAVGVPAPYYYGTLFNLTVTGCTDLATNTHIDCPTVNGAAVDFPGMVGVQPGIVTNTIVNLGYRVVPQCTVDAGGGQNGIVTGVAFGNPGTLQPLGSPVNMSYTKSSCP